MKLIITMCYSRLIVLMCAGPKFSECISGMRIVRGPNHEHEGMAGYIETEVEFTIKDLSKFSALYDAYHHLSEERKLDVYALAKGLGDCK